MTNAIYYPNRLGGAISCPMKYFKEASSINFHRSVKYGFGVLATTFKLACQRVGLVTPETLQRTGQKIGPRLLWGAEDAAESGSFRILAADRLRVNQAAAELGGYGLQARVVASPAANLGSCAALQPRGWGSAFANSFWEWDAQA